jgi:outer membrane protein OmpA-like peptidoglycan-associated protein
VSLKLFVVGHTDNVGTVEANMKLSKDRADAVVNALITKFGIPAARLKSYGVASLSPVATNDNEEGRAKNRRVEMVKQ